MKRSRVSAERAYLGTSQTVQEELNSSLASLNLDRGLAVNCTNIVRPRDQDLGERGGVEGGKILVHDAGLSRVGVGGQESVVGGRLDGQHQLLADRLGRERYAW